MDAKNVMYLRPLAEELMAKDPKPIMAGFLLARYTTKLYAHLSMFEKQYDEMLTQAPLAYYNAMKWVVAQLAFLLNLYQSDTWQIEDGDSVSVRYRWYLADVYDTVMNLYLTTEHKPAVFVPPDNLSVQFAYGPELGATICLRYAPVKCIKDVVMAIRRKLIRDAKTRLKIREQSLWFARRQHD